MALLVPKPPTQVEPTRVVIDLRPLQEPERMPITAEYLLRLTDAFAADPLAGESFVTISRAMRPDPAVELERRGLPVEARRVVPPTGRFLRSAGLTIDSFLLRGAEIATPAAVYHTAGGAVPLGSRLPIVATVLDLAPWELPHTYAATPAARFGHRLRARVLQDAARVIVCSKATAESARKLLNLPSDRVAVVPLAVDDEFRRAGGDREARAAIRQRLELPERYLVFGGRYDARKDLATLMAALVELAGEAPLVVLAGQYDAVSDEEALRRAAARGGATSMTRVAGELSRGDRAALIGGAAGFVYPALSEATGLPVLEALALGVPVICSRAGVLPETVGSGGIIVEPRDARRMASAIEALAADGPLAIQIRAAAERRAASDTRTWLDVARETRVAYAEAARGATAGATGQRRERRPPTAPSGVSG
jgi:glycosyltransferase involved in cell wall biosynthesis